MEPIRSHGKSLSEHTADQIISYILTEKLLPDDKLPNELVLADALGVGRSTVREAEKLLASRNIIRIEHGRGTFIAQTPGVVDDPLGFQFVQNKAKLLLELLELRLIIEPSLAALAAEHAADAEIVRLTELEEKIENAYRAGDDHTPFDVSFHSELAKCSHNSVVELIFPLFMKAVPMTIEYTQRTLSPESIEDHRTMIEAIRRRDAETARKAMEEHIRRNIRYIRAARSE